MPAIHVIYDPFDRMSHNAEMNIQHGISVAILSLPKEHITKSDITEISEQLIALLLEQIRWRS